MPRLDGSGPRGLGAKTGRGQGRCQAREVGQGRRMGQRMKMQNMCGQRSRRRMHNQDFFSIDDISLVEKRDLLMDELDKVNELLESL